MSDNEQPNYDDFTRQILQQYNQIAQLAGALAHEIKNPLSVICMNVDLLSEDLDDEGPLNRRRAVAKIEIVRRQCERLQNLLHDFLKFARLRKLDLSPGNLNEQIGRVLDLFAAQADDQQIDVVRYLDPDLPSIMLDEQTLEAALVNLVKNAIEAMPDGGQLTARTRLTRSGVALDLIDTGPGMDESTAMHMFDAFYSTKDGARAWGCPRRGRWSRPTAPGSMCRARWGGGPSSRWSSRRRPGSRASRSRPTGMTNPDMIR